MSRTAKVATLFDNDVNPQALQDAHWRATDIANAAAFVALHGADLRFAHGGGGWYTWRHGCWQRDVTQSTCALAQTAITRWWKEVGAAGSPEERTVLAKHFLASGRAQRVQALLTLAAADHAVALPPDAFDRDPSLFTVANGTLDLRTGILHPHRQSDLISKRSPIAYDPNARCPRFLEFLDLVFAHDQPVIDFVQVAGGYSMTGSVAAQCLFFCYGTGANGKSTFFNIMQAVLGQYARVAAPGLLMQAKFESHPTEVADLLGARFVTSVETEQDRRLAEVKLKQLTGGDPLKARFMRENFFEFMPTHKFWLAGNYKPVVQGTDPAIWRRLHLIPFVVNLKEQLQDNLVDDFAATLRDEYPGILRWLVEGAMAWHADGLRPPATVQAATAAYKREMDTIAQWVEEFCTRDPRARTPFKVLFSAYQDELKSDAISKRAFAAELDRLGVLDVSTGGIAVRSGVRLRPQHDDHDDHPYES